MRTIAITASVSASCMDYRLFAHASANKGSYQLIQVVQCDQIVRIESSVSTVRTCQHP